MANKEVIEMAKDNRDDFQDTSSMFEHFATQGQVPNKDSRERNKSKQRNNTGIQTFDLHGYTLDKALFTVENKIYEAKKHGTQVICFITGIGKHSEGMHAVLPNGLTEYLNSKNYRYEKNRGVFKVWLKK